MSDWLRTLAPLLGTALGGPLGGAAASFIADKLGIENKTIEAVSEVLNSGKMSPEQISNIKLAEIEFQKFLEQNKIDTKKLEMQDTQSARDMQVSVRSPVPATLSFVVTVGYFGILAGMLTSTLKVADSQALLLMLGSLSTAWGMVMAFWFGSTRASENKTHLLAQSSPVKGQ